MEAWLAEMVELVFLLAELVDLGLEQTQLRPAVAVVAVEY